MLDVLTPDDVRMLAASEDELERLGEFERIFPSALSSRYLRFFESPRYLNILLDQWERKYWNNRQRGMSVLSIHSIFTVVMLLSEALVYYRFAASLRNHLQFGDVRVQTENECRGNNETAGRLNPDFINRVCKLSVLHSGIRLLRSLCEKGIHLGTDDPAHMVRNRGKTTLICLKEQQTCMSFNQNISDLI